MNKSQLHFDHSLNTHSITGAENSLKLVFSSNLPASLADFGCGVGTWLKAASNLGIADFFGLEGETLSNDSLLVDRRHISFGDITKHVDLGRRFDVVICMEVAEHIEPSHAQELIQNLTRHSDRILFSAAAPTQIGQHHVNCQWPDYWQKLFNSEGYTCADWPRWKIWSENSIEWWYRQNMFEALRDPCMAGNEARIQSVYHPDFLHGMLRETANSERESLLKAIHQGEYPLRFLLASTKNLLIKKCIP